MRDPVAVERLCCGQFWGDGVAKSFLLSEEGAKSLPFMVQVGYEPNNGESSLKDEGQLNGSSPYVRAYILDDAMQKPEELSKHMTPL